MGLNCDLPDEDNVFVEYFNYVVESLHLQPLTNWRQALLYENVVNVAGF